MRVDKVIDAKISGNAQLPLIKNYRDYRRFLKEHYEFKKSLRAGFSFRQFSARCGFKSPNYLQLIIKGDRNLSVEMAENVAQAVGLRHYEKDYFISLVQQENSSTDDELNRAKKESLVAIKKMSSKQITNDQNKVFCKWYHLLVRELVIFKNFEPSGKMISDLLGNEISPEDAEKSWSLLCRSKFVTQLENGKWTQTAPVLDSGDGVFQDLIINQYHLQNLQLWQKKLATESAAAHELGLLNIPIQKEKIPELRNRIRQFQDEIVGWLQDEKNPDALLQLGTYMFRIK